MSKIPLLDPGVVREDMNLDSLPDQAYEVVRHSLLAGRLEPGTRLNQRDLAKELGVGTSTVREALKRLAAVGLVVEERRKGFRVAVASPGYQRDLGEVISSLEQLAVGLAALKITSDQLARLRELLPQTIWGSDPDVVVVKRADREFHYVIWEAAQRPELTRLLGQTWDKYHIPGMSHYNERDWERQSDISRIYHREILEALEARDATGARDAVTRYWEADIRQDEGIFTRLLEERDSSGTESDQV
jgi:DNA-binding GntR family transcriptional regulator